MAGIRARPAGAGQVTSVVEDYLKVIWKSQEWSAEPVTTSLLAERLGVGAPTVSETLRRLVAHGWVEHEPYRPVTLTAEGRRLALGMVRRHRLIETWLVEQLGYGWDEVHDEAEVLEHAVSDRFVEALDARLGRPRRDPHGDPIPSRDGEVESPPAIRAVDLGPGERAAVAQVDDDDPDVLRQCTAVGIGLDVVLTGPVELPDALVAALRVVRLDAVAPSPSPATGAEDRARDLTPQDGPGGPEEGVERVSRPPGGP